MHKLLFVYGSLLSSIAHAKGEQLRRDADLVGPGSIQGQLFRVSWYPCVVASQATEDRVHGEIYRLRDPVATLAWLDDYEGLTPSAAAVADADEYERVIVAVIQDDGTTTSAWIYRYRRPVTTLARIASGRWTG